jgi:hypothetical protein
MHLLRNALHRTLQANVSNAQDATLSSRKSALLPPNEHANAFWHQKLHSFQYSELGFWSRMGLNLAHGIIATVSGDMHANASPCTFLLCTSPQERLQHISNVLRPENMLQRFGVSEVVTYLVRSKHGIHFTLRID